MSDAASIDYDALAKQHGAISSAPDYDALAKEHGAIAEETPSPESPQSFWDRTKDFLHNLGAGNDVYGQPLYPPERFPAGVRTEEGLRIPGTSLTVPALPTPLPERLETTLQLLSGEGGKAALGALGKGAAKVGGGAALAAHGHPLMGMHLAVRSAEDLKDAAGIVWNAFKATGGATTEEFEQWLANQNRIPVWKAGQAEAPPPTPREAPPAGPQPVVLRPALPSGRAPGGYKAELLAERAAAVPPPESPVNTAAIAVKAPAAAGESSPKLAFSGSGGLDEVYEAARSGEASPNARIRILTTLPADSPLAKSPKALMLAQRLAEELAGGGEAAAIQAPVSPVDTSAITVKPPAFSRPGNWDAMSLEEKMDALKDHIFQQGRVNPGDFREVPAAEERPDIGSGAHAYRSSRRKSAIQIVPAETSTLSPKAKILAQRLADEIAPRIQ